MLRRSATAALVSLGIGLPAWPQAGGPAAFIAGPPDQEVLLEADKLTYGWEGQILNLDGHVVMRRGDGVVRAATGTFDRAHGILSLQGGVLGVQGKDVFLSDEAVIDLNTRVADLKKAVLYLKERTPPAANPTAGKNSLILHAPRVRRLADGSYAAEEVTMTPCDCVGEPDYEILAHEAKLHGDRADLSGARLRLFGAPIPLFPLSLPLTQRQPGLLAPEFGFGGPFWFTFAQPVFFTLGRSNDLTVTPGFYTGGTDHGQAPGLRSVKGPRLGLEWRYAPIAGTTGSLSFDLYDDLDQRDSSAAAPAWSTATVPGARASERGTSAGRGFDGVRGLAHLNHRTEDGPFVFAVQGVAATDVMAGRDPQPYALDSLQDLLRTDIGAWSARGPLTLGADATLMQDIRLDGTSPDRRLFGAEARATFQRLPAVFAQLAPVPLGFASFEVEASAVQFESPIGAGPEERETGFGPTDRGASTALPLLPYDGSRSPALRFDLAPRLRLSSPATMPLDLRAEAGARLDSWVMEGHSDRDRSRAYALVGGSAGLPLERRFGDFLHRIEPGVAVRALSKPLQSGGPPIGDLTDAGGPTFTSSVFAAEQGLAPLTVPGMLGVPAARRAYDEIDFAAPESGAVEATFSLSQALWKKVGAGPVRLLSFDLLQDVLLWAQGSRARLSETSGNFGASLGPVGLSAGARYDWSVRKLSSIGASATARDGRTDEVHSSFNFLRGSSSARLRGGIDELFSAAKFDVPPGALNGSAGAGGSTPLPKNFRLGYDGSFTSGVVDKNFANFVHTATLTYETACKCALVQLVLGFPLHDTHLLRSRPDFSFRLDLKSLGSFATF